MGNRYHELEGLEAGISGWQDRINVVSVLDCRRCRCHHVQDDLVFP